MRKLRNNSRRFAFGYILPTTRRIPDFRRLETRAAGRTEKGPGAFAPGPFSLDEYILTNHLKPFPRFHLVFHLQSRLPLKRKVTSGIFYIFLLFTYAHSIYNGTVLNRKLFSISSTISSCIVNG